jgi:hypothetical protein
MPLSRGELQRRSAQPGAVHALLLLDLPQDGRRGGYAINLGADAATLKVRGRKHVGIYHAILREAGRRATRSSAGRHFCRECGSALWLWDPRWPELVHPHASAIDTPLPKPPETMEIGLDWAPSWVEVPRGPRHHHRAQMPSESLEDWHRRHGLWSA